jgi:acetoin utilization protein AcuB
MDRYGARRRAGCRRKQTLKSLQETLMLAPTALRPRPQLRTVTVRDCMTRDPVVVEESACVSDAIDQMERYGVRHLPVLAEDGRLVGVVTERHLRDCVPSRLAPPNLLECQRLLASTPVLQVADRDPGAIPPEVPIPYAIARMRRLRVGCLPVLSEGRLVGILTSGDLVALLERLLLADEAEDLQ